MNRRELLTGLAGGAMALGTTLPGQKTAGAQGAREASEPRPNILWVVIEDTSAYEFACYGHPTVKTPVIDDLARRGVRYTRAWSAGPQCSPSRSSLITGSFSTTYGMDWHRKPIVVPDNIFFPPLLRQAGYYCTNNQKTDYNAKINAKSLWDEMGPDASYSSPLRKTGQPFFAVFNCMATHMSRIRSFSLEGRRPFAEEGLDPQKLALPPHVPDLPEVRSDYAYHLEGVQDIDLWVGFFLQDLKARGLDEDTIVFFYSDHGGCQPRGKGFVYDTGLRVPLIVSAPPRFQNLVRSASGDVSDRLVHLMDLGPTVLSLAGIPTPDWMAGRAFLGRHEATPHPYQYGFAANQAAHFVPSRSISDGHFHLVRSYTPHKPYSVRNSFQWGLPSNLAWDEYALHSDKQNPVWMQTYRPHKGEMLFDLKADPFEVSDLSADPKHQETLTKLRAALDAHLSETRDLGLFPPSARHADEGIYQWTRATRFPLPDLLEAARVAANAAPSDAPKLVAYLQNEQPAIRFWGASGFATLAVLHPGKTTAPAELIRAMNDADPYVAAEAAHALCHLGQSDEAVAALMKAFAVAGSAAAAYSALETLALTPAGRAALRPYEAALKKMGHVEEAATAAGAQTPPPSAAGNEENEDGARDWLARAILVNLEALPVKRLYKEAEQEAGVKVSTGRKPLTPRPAPVAAPAAGGKKNKAGKARQDGTP